MDKDVWVFCEVSSPCASDVNTCMHCMGRLDYQYHRYEYTPGV